MTPVIHCKFDSMVSLSEIHKHLNPKNRNKHPKEQIDAIAKQFEYQGIRHPIIISKRSTLVAAGEGRYLAAEKLGMEAFPVSYQDFESEEQEYAFGVADNALAAQAYLDFAGINADLPDLGPDFDIELLGIKDFKLDASEKEGLTDEDEVPEVNQSQARSKFGELYQLGEHRLLCGDSTDSDSVARLMNGEKADMVFTDPPYGLGGYGGRHSKENEIENDRLTGHQLIGLLKSIPKAKNVFVWCDARTLPEFYEALGRPNDLIVWKKPWPSMGRGYRGYYELCMYFGEFDAVDQFDLWDIGYREEGINSTIQRRDASIHPTQKPVALAEKAIRNHIPGTVLDLFLGSGSTLIACQKTNRRCFGAEIDPHYVDLILDRWSAYTGKDPVREDGVPWSKLKADCGSIKVGENNGKRKASRKA